MVFGIGKIHHDGVGRFGSYRPKGILEQENAAFLVLSFS